MVKKFKKYKFTYLDRSGNELTSKILDCFNKDEASCIAWQLLMNSNLNDLYEIKTKRI